MATDDGAAANRWEDLPESFRVRREERDRRIAEIRARAAEFDPDSTPEMKALRKSNEEYRESIREITDRMARRR
jgi:hypothetical protein